jgi:O-antigen/teichoic acid export membrane protein
VLIARALGPAGNGRYALAMTIGTMAALVASLGFEQAQAKAWSGAQRSRAELVGAALHVGATTGGGVALLLVALWTAGSAGVFDGLGLLTAILIVAALVPLRVLLALLRGLLIVGGQLERSNLALAAGDLARTLVIVALALAGALSVETAVATFWVATLVALALHARPAGRPRRAPAGFVRAQLREGALMSPYFAFVFLNLRLDVLLLAALSTPRSVGVYAVAVIFAELVWLATDAVSTGARERQWGTSDGDAAAMTAAAARMSALVALLALPVLAVAAPVAIHLVFGRAFAGATDALWALLPAAVAMAWWRALGAGLVRFGRPRVVNAIAMSALVANVVLNVCLIGPLGIVGAALASLGSYLLGAALAASAFARGRVRLRDLLPGAGDLHRLAVFARGAPAPGRARRRG